MKTRSDERAHVGRKSRCAELSQMPPFQTLPSDMRAALERICRPKALLRNDVLVHSGDIPTMVGFVTRGVLRMEKTLVDGQRQIVGLLVAGNLFGRVFDGAFPFAMEAATDCEICLFPKPQFEALLEDSPELERLVLLNLLNELDSAREWLGLLAYHRTIDKIAGFLVFMHRRWGHLSETGMSSEHGTLIDLPISRLDLAETLGTRPEGVSRALHALQDRQLIKIVTPYRFAVRDFDALERISGQAATDFDARAALLANDPIR